MMKNTHLAAIAIAALLAAGALPLHAELPAHAQAVLDTAEASLLPEDGISFQGSDEIASCQEPETAGDPWRVQVQRKPAKRWEVGLKWSPPVDVDRGDLLLWAFEVRATKAPKGKGRADCVVRTGPKPYIASLGEDLTLTGSWRQMLFVFPATAHMPANTALFGINLGAQKQTVEIRRIRAVSFRDRLTAAELRAKLGVRPTVRANQVVGEPLTPQLLWLMGAFEDFAETAPEFRPDGAWRQEFLIWTCHGYMGRSNKHAGLLELERIPLAEGTHTLKIRQQLANDRGILHTVAAETTCRTDALGSPVSWKLTSQFAGPGNTDRPELTETEAGRIADGTATIRAGTGEETPVVKAAAITADWCLFEAVQRLNTPEETTHRFAMLEGLSLAKTEQQLHAAGTEEITVGGKQRRVRRLQQTGRGVLPYEYLVDADTNQLLAVITFSRAYIQSKDARATFSEYARRQKAPVGTGND